MACSRPFTCSVFPWQPECLTLRLPPPRPPLDHSALARHSYVCINHGVHGSCCRCAMSTRTKKNGTRTRAATLAVVLPHPRPGDLAVVGIRDGRARETCEASKKLPRVVWHGGPLCLIDNKFPSLASPTTAPLQRVSLPDKKELLQISHHVMYVHSSAPVRAPGSVARQCRYVVAPDSLAHARSR